MFWACGLGAVESKEYFAICSGVAVKIILAVVDSTSYPWVRTVRTQRTKLSVRTPELSIVGLFPSFQLNLQRYSPKAQAMLLTPPAFNQRMHKPTLQTFKYVNREHTCSKAIIISCWSCKVSCCVVVNLNCFASNQQSKGYLGASAGTSVKLLKMSRYNVWNKTCGIRKSRHPSHVHEALKELQMYFES